MTPAIAIHAMRTTKTYCVRRTSVFPGAGVPVLSRADHNYHSFR